MRSLFAYTPPGDEYPEYLSINESDDGEIEITVRAPKKPAEGARPYALPGDTAVMRLPREELAALITALWDERERAKVR